MSPGCARAVRRAARLTASPITAYVRRVAPPMSPVKTWPRLTPARSGRPTSVATIVAQRAQHPLLVLARARRRAAGEVELDGVDVDVRLEPRERRRSSHARADRGGERVDAARAAPSGPSAAISSSVCESFTNATVTWRCSASPLDTARCARSGAGHVLVEARARHVGRRRDRARAGLEPRASGARRRAPRRATRDRRRRRSRR